MCNVVFVLFSGQELNVNATYNLGTTYGQQANLQEADYTDDVVNLGAEGCEEGDVGEEGYQGEEYTGEYSQDNNAGMPEDQMDYTGELAEGEDGYQDEVLDIQINEPLDGDFQVSFHICLLTCKSQQMKTHMSSHFFFCPALFNQLKSAFLCRGRGQSGLKIYSGEGDVGWGFFGQGRMRFTITSCQLISPSCWRSLCWRLVYCEVILCCRLPIPVPLWPWAAYL